MCAGGGKHPKAHAARGARERAAPNIVQADGGATGRAAGADALWVPSPGGSVGDTEWLWLWCVHAMAEWR